MYLFLQGVGDGSQPLISRYYGEKNTAVMNRIRLFAHKTGLSITLVCAALLFLARGNIGILFGASAESNQGIISYLPLFLAAMPLVSFIRITTSYLYATEKVGYSYILVYAEPIILLLFLSTIPLWFGLPGVWAAVPLSQLIAFAAAVLIKYRMDYKAA
ncbi:Na+-driven multidrug efflux pump [Pasteurella testudinis DSM 23072]|uniref:Na+-driven multidrug efflux pump n=1 Tax=Pasteurella testudinis DSM 23072 TaxID=1122938 RepID=A0A1W1V873_9PAST|nr:Na+-driven multidrug efflux pump [Pasteurella testudinis DSM 23072]SUB52967.1 multidrug efflux pump VmrA [Pasteurella testudinis]